MYRYEENEATYLGMKIAKTNNGEFGASFMIRIITETASILLKFLTIEREHRANRWRKTSRLFPDRNLGSRCGLRELRARARFTTHRPRKLHMGKIIDVSEEKEDIAEIKEKEDPREERQMILSIYRVFIICTGEAKGC